jgi:hypothetical protein
MGEQRTARERISRYRVKTVNLCLDDFLQFAGEIVCLHRFRADNLIYVQRNASGYNSFKINNIPDGAVLSKSTAVNGESNE